MTAPEVFLYLTTTGRKSSQPRTIEIWFVTHAGSYYLVSEKRNRSHWVRNIAVSAAVTFSIGTRAQRESVVPQTQATARTIDPQSEPTLASVVCGLMDAKHGWSNGLIVELTTSQREE